MCCGKEVAGCRRKCVVSCVRTNQIHRVRYPPTCHWRILEKVLSREVVRFLLDGSARELEVFKAADRWAEKACVRMGVEVTGSGKREALGDSLYLIRFPTIPQETFISGILPKGILSQEEVEDITKYYHSENHQLKYPFSTVDRFRIPIQF